MTLAKAVATFDDWSHPWKFEASVREALVGFPAELEIFEDVMIEVSKSEHWAGDDLVHGGRIAHSAGRTRFPEVDVAVIDSAVRAASYCWR